MIGPLSLWERGAATAPPATVAEPEVGAARRLGVRFRREYVIGDKRYVIESDGELEWILVERIKGPVRVARVPKSAPAIDIPVNAEPSGELAQWVPIELPRIDWQAVTALREQSERLRQSAVLDALTRIVAAWRAARDDDDDVEMLLLS